MYVQDYITWFDSLHLLVGARYDIADITVGRSISDYSGGPELIYAPSKSSAFKDRLRRPTQISTGWSPRVGVVYDFLPELSAFVSYSRSFGQYGGFDPAAGKLFPPEKGLQWEFGLKAQPLSGVLATLSFFQITKSGVSTGLFGSVQASQQAGLQRSRGVELDVIGAVTDRMSVLANYAYTDAKVISDDPPNPSNPFGMLNPAVYGAKGGLLGNHLEFAPRHSGKLFVTYDFGENGLGFRVGGGVTASTHWWGDIQNTFLMPSYARLDGFVSYTAELSGHRITAKLNLQNINNVRYFDAVDSYVNVFSPPYYRIPARPFQAVGTVGFQW
jgi:iron complex outermembrane receptor protein